MFLVAVTGGIATGKSTVSKMLAKLGCPVVNADEVAREVVEPGTRGLKKIKAAFGDEVINEDGSLNREKLGQIIFADAKKRAVLNGITHPEIYKAMVWKISKIMFKGHPFAILEVPLLFETGKLLPYISYTIVVYCSPEQQLSRLMLRNKLSEEEAQQRINAQMPLDEKCRQATFVVDNCASVKETGVEVSKLHATLCSSRKHWRLRLILATVVTGVVSLVWYFGRGL